MTSSSLSLIKLPGSLFQESSPNSKNLIAFLTKVINDGYDLNKKYNIITSTRIKNEAMFIDDLGFKNPDNFILVLLKSKNHALTNDEIALSLKNEPASIEIETKGLDFNFNDIDQEQVIGSIGTKIVPDDSEQNGWELTGFVSNAKGVGKYLINKHSSIAAEAKQDYILASVIVEHNLVTYYGQYGFVEYDRILQEVDENGLLTGGSLEDGIYATQNFHVAFLKKVLTK